MERLGKALIIFTFLSLPMSLAQAAPVVVDGALVESLEIEGVSLGMTPKEAVDHLFAIGYTAGNITSFEEWTDPLIEMVRGTFREPVGESRVVLQRNREMLVVVRQSLNRANPRIDVGAEMSALQSHFGIAADEVDCRMNGAGTAGSCEVVDTDEDEDIDLRFTGTFMPTMIMRSASRQKHLNDW